MRLLFAAAAILTPQLWSPCQASTDLLAVTRAEVRTDDSDWAAEAPAPVNGQSTARARWKFAGPDRSGVIALTLEKPSGMPVWRLNGQPVPLPLPDVRYATVPGIPPKLLREGENVLEAEWKPPLAGAPPVVAKELKVRLLAMTAEDLDFTTGPILGPAPAGAISVSCRTNVPATVSLEAGGRRSTSPEGTIHTLRLTGLGNNRPIRYSLTARAGDRTARKALGPFTTRTLPQKAPFTFVALGDSRSRPQDWARVAELALQQKPAFVTQSGDLVGSGREDRMWQADLFGAAPAFFETVPLFAVQGNHDEDSPLFHRFFDVEPGQQNWSRVVGPALFIGINGTQDWSPGTPNLAWLEGVLKRSREKHIFLVSHYAGWSSGPGGDPARGVLLEPAVRRAQENIVPLLAQAGATVMLAGHSHFYERSEPPGGPTTVITGGAGAPLYQKRSDAAVANPHSVAFASRNHICRFDVTDDAVSMKVIATDGQVLDERTWPARPAALRSGAGKDEQR